MPAIHRRRFQCMIVRGTWDWNLVKIETDAGAYGIGEAYWGPGVKDVIAKIFKPLLIGEDPLNVDKLYTKILMRNAGNRRCTSARARTSTRGKGFLKLIELQGCDGVHIDIPKSGRLLESKRISDLADDYYIWKAAHNPASPVGTIASAHAAASMRNFRIHELANDIDWWPDLVIHEGPIWENGYLTIQDKPGYGIELNPDGVPAHLAPGETWWG